MQQASMFAEATLGTALPLTKPWHEMTREEFRQTAIAHTTLRLHTRARRGRPAMYKVRGPEHLEAIVPQRPPDCPPLKADELKLQAIEAGHWHEQILAKVIRAGLTPPTEVLEEYPVMKVLLREQRARCLWQYLDFGDTILAAEESAWKGGAHAVVTLWCDQRALETVPSWKVSVGWRTDASKDLRIVFFEKEQSAQDFAAHLRSVAELRVWHGTVEKAELQLVALYLAQDDLFEKAAQYGALAIPAPLREALAEVQPAIRTAKKEVLRARRARPMLPRVRIARSQLVQASKSGDEIWMGAARSDYAEAVKLDGASCAYSIPLASLPLQPDLTPLPDRLAPELLDRLEQAVLHPGPTPEQWGAAAAEREQMARFGLPYVYWITGTALAGTGFRLERHGDYLYAAEPLSAEEVARHALVPLGAVRGPLLAQCLEQKQDDVRVELFRNVNPGEWDAWAWWRNDDHTPVDWTSYRMTAAGLSVQQTGLQGESLWADIAAQFEAGYRLHSPETMVSLSLLPSFISGSTGLPFYARPAAEVIEHLTTSHFPFYFPAQHRVLSLGEWLAKGGQAQAAPLGLRFLWEGRPQPYVPVHELFGHSSCLPERTVHVGHLLQQFQRLQIPVPEPLAALDRELAEACRLAGIPYLAPSQRSTPSDVLTEPGRYDAWRMTAPEWTTHCENLGLPSPIYLKGREDESLSPVGITFSPRGDAAVSATVHHRNGQAEDASAADIASCGDRPFIDGTATVARKYLLGWLYGTLAHLSDDYRKVHALRVRNALWHGQFHAAIALGDMTTARAREILQSAGVEVPRAFESPERLGLRTEGRPE